MEKLAGYANPFRPRERADAAAALEGQKAKVKTKEVVKLALKEWSITAICGNMLKKLNKGACVEKRYKRLFYYTQEA